MAWSEQDYHSDAQAASKAGMAPGKSFTRALYNLERIANALEAWVAFEIRSHEGAQSVISTDGAQRQASDG